MRLITTIAFALLGLTTWAQTSLPDLPAGAQRYSQTLWIVPSDSTLWTGATGNYAQVATREQLRQLASQGYTKSQVDSLMENLFFAPSKGGYRYTVVPNRDVDNDIVGVTGLSYKLDTDEYVISYYSYAKEAKLWFYKRNSDGLIPFTQYGAAASPVPDREIDVTPYIDHIQGNVWDADSACYWIVGTKKGFETSDTARVLISVGDNGNLISTHSLTGVVDGQMGQITRRGNILMIKPNNDPVLYFMDRGTKAIIRTESTHTQFEGLGYDDKRDLVWILGDEGKVVAYDYDTFMPVFESNFATTPDGARTNVEGVIIDPIDDKLVVGFDGYLHGFTNNGNAIFKFDFPRYTSKYPNTLYLRQDAPISTGSSASIFRIRNATADVFGGNLLAVSNYGQLSGRLWLQDGTLSGGYAITTPVSENKSLGVRFAQFNRSTGTSSGDIYIEAISGMGGLAFGTYLSPSDDYKSYLTLDFLKKVAVYDSTSISDIDSAPARSLVTKEYLFDKVPTLPADNTWSGSQVFAPNVTSPQPPNGSTQIGFASAGSGTGPYVRGFDTVGDQAYLIRGYTHTSGVQATFNKGAVSAPQYRLTALNSAPDSATAAGTTGEIRITATHIYICTATNTWVRAELSTW